jgi:hypothetical protein
LIAVPLWWEMSKMRKPWAKLEGIKTSICPLDSSTLHYTPLFVFPKTKEWTTCALLFPAPSAEYPKTW